MRFIGGAAHGLDIEVNGRQQVNFAAVIRNKKGTAIEPYIAPEGPEFNYHTYTAGKIAWPKGQQVIYYDKPESVKLLLAWLEFLYFWTGTWPEMI